MLIPAMSRKRVKLWAVGESPLIVHAWDPISRADMLRKQMGLPTQRKRAKNPQACLDACFYMTPDGRYGFPASAFKQAAVGACRFLDAKMTEARGAFFVLGGLLPIHGADPVAREDMVRVGMGVADLRYRPAFEEWAVPLEVEYDSAVIGDEQVINLFSRAGFSPGIGEWRPEKDGTFGRFTIVDDVTGRREWGKRIPRVGSCKVDLTAYDGLGDPTSDVTMPVAIGDAE